MLLVLNAGSSSLKFELFEQVDRQEVRSFSTGQISGIGTHPRLEARARDGRILIDQSYEAGAIADVEQAQDRLEAWLETVLDGPLAALGHRVVHGGPDYAAPVMVDDQLLESLERLIPLAPLHQPANLAPIRRVRRRRPDLPQVACFDTAFHRGHPELADRFAIPAELYRAGVRRYGFHGLSYEYIARRLRELDPQLAAGRIVVAHLGSGCSLCAIEDGRSIDSTMGFTALDGLPMGTRPGQLDAGVVLWLMRERGMDADTIEHLLYHECGLKGLSGISNDMRDLLASDSPDARLSIDYFIYRVAQLTAALATAMGGLDGFVFTAGVGERAASIREGIARRLGWLGVELDPAANAAHTARVSTANSRIAVMVLPTDEELMIARHTAKLIADARA